MKDNTLYVCRNCGAFYDFADMQDNAPCQKCGGRRFDQKVITFVCDFCSVPGREQEMWSYPCAPHVHGVIVSDLPLGASRGDWAACENCHELIERNDRKALVERSVKLDWERHPELHAHPEAKAMLRAMARSIHDGFFRNRTGDAIPPTKGD